MVSLPIPAKGVGRVTDARVQIPPAPPLSILTFDFMSKDFFLIFLALVY